MLCSMQIRAGLHVGDLMSGVVGLRTLLSKRTNTQ
jgi:hypothetical protein